MSRVAGRDGVLQRSAGSRWQQTGEGQGGIIGIESAVVCDASRHVVETRSQIMMDFNCAGMFRAWVDTKGNPQVSIFSDER
jgi:L-asparaginase